jgi:hypothetical protein
MQRLRQGCLTTRPAESEPLSLQTTTPDYLVNDNEVYENSLNI